jgi:hypothetical protein
MVPDAPEAQGFSGTSKANLTQYFKNISRMAPTLEIRKVVMSVLMMTRSSKYLHGLSTCSMLFLRNFTKIGKLNTCNTKY